MPVYEFEDHIRLARNYWDMARPTVLLRRAVTTSSNPVRELKEMVKACHQAGIEVILHLPFYDAMPKQKMIECLRYYRQSFMQTVLS